MSATITSAAATTMASATMMPSSAMRPLPASVESLLSQIPPQVLYSLTVSGISPAVTSALAEGHLPPGICIEPPPRASIIDLPGTSTTLHQMMLIIGGIMMGLTVIASVFTWLSHLIWRSNYREQSTLMRIAILPMLYGVLSFVSIWSYEIGPIVDPISKLYVAYCVNSYFNYMVEVVIPNHNHSKREDFFISSERRRFFGQSKKHPHGSLRWWRFNAVICYTSLFVNLIVFIVQEIISQSTCRTTAHFANAILILNVINAVFTIVGLAALPKIWWRFRDDNFAHTYVLRRFATFKPYVAIIVLQSFVLGVITYVQAVTPTAYMSMADFQVGIPGFLTCTWSFIFVWGFTWTLSGTTYRNTEYRDRQPVWKYLWYFAFPRDVLVGAFISLLYFISLLGKPFDYTGGTGFGWIDRQPSSEDLEAIDDKKGVSAEDVVEQPVRELSDSDGSSDRRDTEASVDGKDISRMT